MLSVLYNQVDEEVHKLVILSNKCQKELESLLEVRMFEEQTQQVSFSFCPVLLLLFWTLINGLFRSKSGSAARERSSSYLWNRRLCQGPKLRR